MATITHLPGAAPAHAAPPGPATALLQVDNVSLEYRTPQSVVRTTHRVSFDVYQADRFVLLGASVPSRLLDAFPPAVPVRRLPLAEVAEQARAFLGGDCTGASAPLEIAGNGGATIFP